MTSRTPPQAPDVEAALLGAALLDERAAVAVLAALRPGDLYEPRHRRVLEAIAAVHERGERADLVSVNSELAADAPPGAGSLLSSLTTRVATTDAATVEQYARVVAEKALLRRIIETAMEATAEAYAPAADPFTVAERLQRDLTAALADIPSAGSTPLSAALDEAIERAREAEAARKRGRTVTGVPTGFLDLDRITSGWQRGEMIVLAGRPSMGKSSMALGSAIAAGRAGVGTLLFSLEMGNHLFAQRALAAEADLDAFALRSGRLFEDDWQRISAARSALAGLPVRLIYEPGLSPERFEAQVARAKAQLGDALGLVVVDYLQLMSARAGRDRNREQEVADISRAMKAAAGRYDVAVLALSQLSRAVESRSDKRPMLSDLRESGALEQDCDAALFIYRAERYGIAREEITTPEGRRVEVDTEGLAEVIVGKQRSGPIGTAYLGFDASRARFYDRAFADGPGRFSAGSATAPAGGDGAYTPMPHEPEHDAPF